jgi:hypothetical protein
VKTFSHLWQYLAKFFLEWEMFQIKVVEKIKTHILCSVTFFSESSGAYELMTKNTVEPERRQTPWRMRVACPISKATRTKSHFCASTLTPTQPHVRTRIASPTRARTHTHPLVAFQRQLWFRERAILLPCANIATLVFFCHSSAALVGVGLPKLKFF